VTDWDVDQVLDTSPALDLGRAPNISNVKLRIIHHTRLTHPELDKFALKRAGCIVPAVAEHVVVWSLWWGSKSASDAKDFPLLLG